jgi:hypothetical protein
MQFSRSLVRIKYIQFIQNDLRKAGVNKEDYKIWYLNQTYHLHLVSSWQVFIQDQVRWSFDELLDIDKSSYASELLNKNIEKYISSFSTPSKDNIENLFKETIGIEKITFLWEACGKNFSSMKFLYNLAYATSFQAEQVVQEIIGKPFNKKFSLRHPEI